MNILLYVSIAWLTLCVLFVGLDLIVLLIVEHASNASQAMGADDSISDQARQIAKLELAMDETVRRQARQLAGTSDALAQLEDRVTLAPRDAILTADGAVARSDPAHGRGNHSRSETYTCTHLGRSKWHRAQRHLRRSHGLRRSRHCSQNRTWHDWRQSVASWRLSWSRGSAGSRGGQRNRVRSSD